MRRTAVVLALAGTLWPAAACAAPDRAAPGPAPSTSAPVRATLPVATASGSTTQGAYDVLANMPAAAKEHSDKGAEAYARYFFEAGGAVNQDPIPGNLARLCTPDFDLCIRTERNVSWLAENKYRSSGRELVVNYADCVPETPDREHQVLVTVGMQQLQTHLLDERGQRVRDWTPPEKIAMNLKVIWTQDHWLASASQLLK